MNFNWKYKIYKPSPLLRAFQFFLLILIIIGVALIVTQDLWISKLVDYLLKAGY